MKITKLISGIGVVLAMSMLLCGTAFASDSQPQLSPEEQEAKETVEQIKQEMQEAKYTVQNSDMPLSTQEEQIYENYLLYIEENNMPNTYDSALSYSESGMTRAARNDITIAIVRSEARKAGNLAGAAGYKMVQATFNHSLQDNPPNLTWNAGTTYSNELKTSSDYKDLVTSIKSELRSTTGTYWDADSSLAFNDPQDVYLSLHNADYTAAAEKVSGKWKIYIRFFDTYDFAFDEDYPDSITTWINNFAYDAQELGAIVPYNIIAYTQETL